MPVTGWPWPDLDHARAARSIEPHLAGADRGPLVPCGSGDFCLAFRNGDTIVRVAHHREAAEALAREVCVLARIAGELPVPVPRPVYRSPNDCPPFTIHDTIDGAVLGSEEWLALDAPARRRAASDLARVLAALHDVPARVGLECGLPVVDAATMARALREPAMRELGPLLAPATARELGAELERWSVPPRDEAPRLALLHRDVAPGHLLHDPATGALTGLIDFGDLALGDPARDFIYVYEDYGPAILGEVLAEYDADGGAGLRPGIRLWTVLEGVEWTLARLADRDDADVAVGVAGVARALADRAPAA